MVSKVLASSIPATMLESLLLAFTRPPTDAQAILALKLAGYRAAEILAHVDTALDNFASRQNQDANLHLETAAQVAA